MERIVSWHVYFHVQAALDSLPRCSSPDLPLWRKLIASVGCLTAAGSFAAFNGTLPWALALPVALLLVSGGLLFRRHLPSQILVRAALWSNLILGFLVSITGHSGEVDAGFFMVLGTAAGLLSLGRSGLRENTSAFAPVAFRSSLVLALVMALADTQSLLLFGGVQVEDTYMATRAVPTLACAALMLVALVGLYRLKVWGLVLNIVANLVIAGLAFSSVLDLPPPIVAALCTTAVVQLLLPAPLLVAMVRGSAPATTRFARLRTFVVPTVVLAMVALAGLGFFTPGKLVNF
jgi:hypothetical protein